MNKVKKEKAPNKIIPVVKILFSTTTKKYPMFFVLETIKTVVSILQPFVSLLLIPLLIDELVGDRDIKKLIIYVAGIVLGEFVFTMSMEKINNTLQKYQERLNNMFTMKLGEHSMKLDFQLTEDKKALDQLEKARTGMDWYSGGVYGVAEQIFMFIGNVFKIFGFATLIIMNAPLLLLVILGYVIISGICTNLSNKIEITGYKKLSAINRLFGYFGWSIVDFRYGKDIRLYNAQNMMKAKWAWNTDESVKNWKWMADKTFPIAMFRDMGSALRTLLTYFYAGYRVIKRVFSLGTFAQVANAAGALDSTLGGLVWNIQEIIKRCDYAYEYVLFMEYPEALEKGSDKVKEGSHTIEFRNVSFAYPNTDKLILDNVSIKISPEEHLSIVGLNGAGKTTFIKLLCRLYDPTGGEILMDGKNIKEYDYEDYLRQFAPVFQDFKMFGFTFSENITIQDGEQPDLTDLLKLTDLEETSKKFKHGVNTTLFKYFDDEGVEPSGGEQQKMAMARALYKNSPVVILDEPTAALDPMAEYEIYKQFSTLVGGKTAFYISHRLSSCRFCDHIAVFAGGKIAEYGNHDELIRIKDGIYAKMFEAQAQYYR